MSATTRAGDGTVITNAPIVWTSLDTLTADVDPDGLVTIARQAGGTASIRARVAYTDVSDVVILPVRGLLRTTPPEIILRSIRESAHLAAEILDSDGQAVPGPDVTWTTMNPAVGQVEAQEANAARVVAIAPVQARIVASAGEGWVDTAMLVVVPTVASVAVSPDSVLLNVGNRIGRRGGDGLRGGLVTAVAPGIATITSGVDGVLGQASIVVIDPLPEGATIAWTGAAGTTWADANNGYPVRLPDTSDVIHVPVAPANQPVLAASSAIGGLTLETGAVVALAAFDLTVGGDVDAAGAITGTSGRLIMTAQGEGGGLGRASAGPCPSSGFRAA